MIFKNWEIQFKSTKLRKLRNKQALLLMFSRETAIAKYLDKTMMIIE